MELLIALEQSPVLLIGFTFVFSLFIGSFLNVVIFRLPKSLQHEWTKDSAEHLIESHPELKPDLIQYTQIKKPASIVWSRSQCQHCQHQIKPWENIPVLGFMFLKGKCSNCKTKISHRYWLIELICAILSTAVVYYFGWSLMSVVGLLLTWVLIVVALIDYDTMLIPDQISLPLIWTGLFVSLWSVFVTPDVSISGALFGYLLLWAIFHLFKLLTKKEGMGYGDFKLLAAGGAFLGIKAVLVIVIMSSFAGAVIGSLYVLFTKENKPIPFGPYLACGIWITMLYGESIINLYLDFSGFQ